MSTGQSQPRKVLDKASLNPVGKCVKGRDKRGKESSNNKRRIIGSTKRTIVHQTSTKKSERGKNLRYDEIYPTPSFQKGTRRF